MLTQTTMTRELEYGGFWIRAAALFLDGMITLPLAGLSLWISSRNLAYAVYTSLAGVRQREGLAELHRLADSLRGAIGDPISGTARERSAPLAAIFRPF